MILSGLALSGAWKAVKGFLTAIPWQVWLVAGVLLTGWLYGNHRESQGEDRVQADWNAERAENARLAKEAERLARETEIAQQTAFKNALILLDLENANARAELEKDIAALRTDNSSLRVRKRLQCPPAAGVSDASGSAGGTETAQAGLLREDAEFLLRIGREADQVVNELNTCLSLLDAERASNPN